MSFTNPIARMTQQAKFWESSTQRSPRDSSSIPRLPIKNRVMGTQMQGMLQNIEQIQRQLNRMRKSRGQVQGGVKAGHFPFEIYLSPADPSLSPEQHLDLDWRTFRVRNGFVGLREAAHSDRADYPYGNEMPEFFSVLGNVEDDNSCDFVVPVGAAPAFAWLDVRGDADGNNPTVFISDVPPEPSWTFQSGWNDGNFILLGWIDTETRKTEKIAVVQQIVTDHIAAPETNIFRLKEEFGDYLRCKSWNGLVDGQTNVYIAKPHKLRTSITTEMIEGVTYYYSYDADGDIELNIVPRERRAYTGSLSGTLVETCVVTPEWLANDLIYAMPCYTDVPRTVVTPGQPDQIFQVNMLMVGDGRGWAVHA